MDDRLHASLALAIKSAREEFQLAYGHNATPDVFAMQMAMDPDGHEYWRAEFHDGDSLFGDCEHWRSDARGYDAYEVFHGIVHPAELESEWDDEHTESVIV